MRCPHSWVCQGCSRRTRKWDAFFSTHLEGWRRYVRCARFLAHRMYILQPSKWVLKNVSHCLLRRLHPWQTSVVALIHFQHRQPFLKLPNIRRASNMISSLRLQVSAKQLMSNLTFLSINQCTSISLATLIPLIHSSPAWGETNHSLNCYESNFCVKIMSHNAP